MSAPSFGTAFALALLVSCRSQPVADVVAPDAQVPSIAPDASSTVPSPTAARCREGFCLAPAAKFVMGSPPSEPMRGRYTEEQHEVTLTHSFLLGQFELTQREWGEAGYANQAGTMENGAGGTDCVAPECPASVLSWYEAIRYLNLRSDREGLPHCIELEGCASEAGSILHCTGYRQTTASYYDCAGYRLPTRAEFEYALRAGTTTAFYSGPFEPFGDGCFDVPHVSETAWYCANSGNQTRPVGTRRPNAFGFYDMTGNATEYLASNPDDRAVAGAAETDPGSQLSKSGVFGLGGWCYFDPPHVLRSASSPLAFSDLNAQATGVGLRVARTLSEAQAEAWRRAQ